MPTRSSSGAPRHVPREDSELRQERRTAQLLAQLERITEKGVAAPSRPFALATYSGETPDPSFFGSFTS